MFNLTPFGYKPNSIFNTFDDFEKNFFRGFDTKLLDFKTDIIDKENMYLLSAELPGYDKEDISIDINEQTLTISATHKEENDEKDSKGNYIRRERSFGSYKRSFDISNIKADEIKAEYKNGILELELPKLDITPPKQYKIDIQ